jgi:hypothetical protein
MEAVASMYYVEFRVESSLVDFDACLQIWSIHASIACMCKLDCTASTKFVKTT